MQHIFLNNNNKVQEDELKSLIEEFIFGWDHVHIMLELQGYLAIFSKCFSRTTACLRMT